MEQQSQTRTQSPEEDIKQLRRQLEVFQELLEKHDVPADFTDFDAETEELIAKIFGNSSEMLEAYTYAQLGEASGWMNLQEEAQESGTEDTQQMSLQQRKRVIERCIADLEARSKAS